MRTVHSVQDLRQAVAAFRQSGETVGLVPTMGALHEGHLTLVRHAKKLASRAVVSIFVNPTQFGPNEDFARYPRQEAQDAALLEGAGCDLLFLPQVAEMYPEGFSTTVTVAKVSEGLCGAFRPVHFAGVATVVSKLLLQCLPDVALFGEKDYQQLQVIKRLACDLDIPVRIEGSPTVREADGLALSSRNAYLSPEERRIAPGLYAALKEVAASLRAGQGAGAACAKAREKLIAQGFASVDYLEARDAGSLSPDLAPGRPVRILGAARLGKTRLIDNIPG
jgi:pantoate--beta-alanine ligase